MRPRLRPGPGRGRASLILYVGHEQSDDVWVLDTSDHSVVAQIPVGRKPIDVVYVSGVGR